MKVLDAAVVLTIAALGLSPLVMGVSPSVSGPLVVRISSPTLNRTIRLDPSTHLTIRVQSRDGGFNLVEVQGLKVRVSDADCPDRVCVKRGWLTSPGDQAVCLPHRLVVRIEGDGDELDGLSQ